MSRRVLPHILDKQPQMDASRRGLAACTQGSYQATASTHGQLLLLARRPPLPFPPPLPPFPPSSSAADAGEGLVPSPSPASSVSLLSSPRRAWPAPSLPWAGRWQKTWRVLFWAACKVRAPAILPGAGPRRSMLRTGAPPDPGSPCTYILRWLLGSFQSTNLGRAPPPALPMLGRPPRPTSTCPSPSSTRLPAHGSHGTVADHTSPRPWPSQHACPPAAW